LRDTDNIEDWYREELNNYSVEPDNSSWSSLAEDLDATTPLTDETFSDWYKKEVSKLEERPDYTVWEKLSTQLDTTSVWEKLALSLNRYDQLIWWRNIAIRGAVILLLCFGSYLTYNNYSRDNNAIAFNQYSSDKKNNQSPLTSSTKKSITEEIYFDNPKTSDNQKANGLQNQINSQNTFHNSQANQEDNSSKDNINNAIQEGEQENKEIRTQQVYSTADKINQTIQKDKLENKARRTLSKKENDTKNIYASKKTITKTATISLENIENLKTITNRTLFTETNRHQITERSISHLIEEGEFLVKKERNKIVFNTKRFSAYSMFGIYTRRFYAGFNLGLKKQGMLTTLKEDSPLANYQQNTLLDFGSSVGGTVGFLLSDKINLETNININSTAGYKRSFSAEGIAFKENLNLNYSTISFLAKKMNSKSTFDNKVYSTNFIGGVYASYLRSAFTDANGTAIKTADYKKMDYGIVLGMEQDRYITRTLIITPGIRYNQGVANTTNNSSSFNTARNFSFEFNLGVKYIFLKKR
jgi:hypothetical protein